MKETGTTHRVITCLDLPLASFQPSFTGNWLSSDLSLLVSWFKCYNIDLRPIAVLRCANFALQKKSNIWALPSPSQISLGSGSKKYVISLVFLLTTVGPWFLYVHLKRMMLDHKLFTNISLAVSLPTVAVHCSTLFRFSSYHPSHRSHFSPFPLMWTC